MEKPRIGQELLDVPMGDMIRQMAFAIAEGQMMLDANSIEVAEMMGGLKTITNDNGEVIFEDSRVFFGKEKTTYKSAIEMHNLTSDFQLRASIRQAIEPANFDPDNLIDSFTTYTALTGDGSSSSKSNTSIYKTGAGTNIEYYRYVSGDGTSKVYEKVSEFAYNIKRKGSLADISTINIPQKLSMLELGFTPTFYQFVDTIIEVKIAIKYTAETSSQVSVSRSSTNRSANLSFGFRRAKGGTSVSTTQVNASYSQKYSYSAEGSSLLRTKLVPIPPPAILEERIRKLMEAEFNPTPATA